MQDGQKRAPMNGAVGLDGGAVVSDAQDVGSLAGHEAQLFDLTAQELEARVNVAGSDRTAAARVPEDARYRVQASARLG